FFFQAEDGIRDFHVTGVQTCSSDLDRLDRALKVLKGPFGERVDLDVADVAFHAMAHRPDLDDVAHDGELDRLHRALAQDGELDQIGRASCRERVNIKVYRGACDIIA